MTVTDQELSRAMAGTTRAQVLDLRDRIEAIESDTVTLSVDLAAVERSAASIIRSVAVVMDSLDLLAARVSRIERALKPDW